jgi:two-component system chemotaxis response regulator CheY
MIGTMHDGSEPALVLIVEDEEPLAETVAFIVEEAGYRPLVAMHGRQGVQLALEQRPALVITDLMLPHLGGAELIATVRAEARARGEAPPPLILMTAASTAQAHLAGADALLRKPFHLIELEALLARFLEK